MIDARARRPRSVTGSARAGIDDDADTDLVYSGDMPALRAFEACHKRPTSGWAQWRSLAALDL
jgi:hypothetical protein